MKRQALFFLLLAFLARPAIASAYDIALVGTSGELTKERLSALDELIQSVLQEYGHIVFTPAEVRECMKKMAMEAVESLKDAELIGSKLKVDFVVLAHLTPMAGQDSIEMKVYYLPEGRVELLEEIAAQDETQIVVSGMLSRLVTRHGLLGKQKPDVEPGDKGEEKETGEGKVDAGKEMAELLHEEGEEEEEDEGEKLVKDLQEWPEKKKRLGFGTDFKISLELSAGPTVMLTSPRTGGRAGGFAGLDVGYVVVPACGCEFGGEIRTFFGTGDGFAISGYGGFNFRLTPSFPVYGGGRLSIGYFKGISGARRNQMHLRLAGNLTFVIRGRYMLILNPVSIVLLAFDGSPIFFYDAGLAFGVRF
ncbi:MAG: hypothetical protein ABIJ56_09085 [Pseudomonadota bacterium]